MADRVEAPGGEADGGAPLAAPEEASECCSLTCHCMHRWVMRLRSVPFHHGVVGRRVAPAASHTRAVLPPAASRAKVSSLEQSDVTATVEGLPAGMESLIDRSRTWEDLKL